MNFDAIGNKMKNTIASTPSLVLSAAFFIFLAIFLPLTRNYPFFRDDLISFEHVEKVSQHFSAIWDVNSNQRRHPVFFLLLFLESRLFGPAPIGYFLVLFFIHFCNALLVVKLAKQLRLNSLSAILGGLLFLYSSASYQALIFIPSTLITLSLFFFLLGIDAYIDLMNHGRKRAFIKLHLFQVLALLSYEVSIVLPLMAYFLLWHYIEEPKKRLRIFMLTIPSLILTASVVFLFISKDFAVTQQAQSKASFAGLALFFPRLASLARMFLGSLFIPDKNFLFLDIFNNPVVRIAPLILCTATLAVLWLTRNGIRKELFIPKKIVAICLGWIVIAILPHMGNQLTFEHTTRHLYFAMVGFSILFGAFAHNFLRVLRSICPSTAGLIFGTILTYILTLNLLTTADHYEQYGQYQKNLERTLQQSDHEKIQQLFNNR